METVAGPFSRFVRLGRQGQNDNRDIVDAAPDDQRLWNSLWKIGDVGSNLLMDPQDGGVLVGADDEARGDDNAIVLRLRVDVLDAVDSLDDILEQTSDEFDRLVRLVTVGANQDVDHRYANLRLFLARQRKHRQGAGDQSRQEQERRQRRVDERSGQNPREAEFHGVTKASPSFRPARISTPGASPACRGSPG